MRIVGRRAKFLLALGFFCLVIVIYNLWPREPFSGKNFSLRGGKDKILIFVHGVLGDPRATFTNNTTKAFWPQLIADDPEMKGYDILAVSFDAGIRSTLSIEQIATILRTTLQDQNILQDYNEIYFVTHSMGGLIVKRLLLDLWLARSPVLEQQVSGIVFISTPAKGAELADYLNMINVIGMRPLVDLRTYGGNTFLQTIENQWKDYVDNRRPERVPRVFVAYETQPTSGVFVVPQLYAETSQDGRPYPVSADHSSIVKPADRNALIYQWVKARVNEASQAHALVPFKKWEPGPNQTPLSHLLDLFSSSQMQREGMNVKIIGDEAMIKDLGKVSVTGSYIGATWADVLERVSSHNDCIHVSVSHSRREITLSKAAEPKQCPDGRLVCPKIAC